MLERRAILLYEDESWTSHTVYSEFLKAIMICNKACALFKHKNLSLFAETFIFTGLLDITIFLFKDK